MERNGLRGLLAADQLTGQLIVALQHQRQVDGGDASVLDHHAAVDHAGINVRGGAEHQRRQRIVKRAGIGQVAQVESDEVGPCQGSAHRYHYG